MIDLKIIRFSIMNTIVLQLLLLPYTKYFGGILHAMKSNCYIPLIGFSVLFIISISFWIKYLRKNTIWSCLFNILLGNICILVVFAVLKNIDEKYIYQFIGIFLWVNIENVDFNTELKSLVFIIGNMLAIKLVMTYIIYVKRELKK